MSPPPASGHVHPHQLRHTLATQAINRGARLEAIATMLSHRSLRMTLTRADREQDRRRRMRDSVGEDRRALHRYRRKRASNSSPASTAGCSPTAGAQRPVATDCAYETICEGCGYSRPPSGSPPPCRPRPSMRTATSRPTGQPSSTGSSTASQPRPADHRSPE
ncbi:MAG: site-specific integrase [Acidimicrobiaceae bacterium]|nr:site-specific integrase [Acidimicrobiaceae bacterium]